MLHRLYLALVVASVLAASTFAAGNVEAAVKKIRVKNQTDTDIRVKCLHYEGGVGFVMDVPEGQQRTQANVQTGSRGVLVWETFNEKVIVTGSTELDNMNVIITITGDSTNGYQMSQAVTAGDL